MSHNDCPISGRLVDANACRICASLAVIVVAIAVAFDLPWLLGVLVVEFAIRLTVGLGKSPFGRFALVAVRILKLTPKMVDVAPKRFAGGLALVFSVSGLVAGLAGSEVAFTVIASVFGVCAALEAFVGVCIGCHVYSWIPEGLLPARHRVEADRR